jgi:hypothetical protein
MKKYGISVFMLVVLKLLFSELVPENTIRLVAERWLEFQTGQPRTANNWAAFPDASNPVYWKVNCNPGFVYVSADDSCIPILGFCKHGNYYVEEVNEATEDLLQEYANQIEEAKINSRGNTETLPIWNAILNQTTSITEEHDIGLFAAQWEQWAGYSPYNMYCPVDNHNGSGNLRSSGGCVAVAIAQICNYYKYWDYTFGEADRYDSSYAEFNCRIDEDSVERQFPNFDTLNGYLEAVQNNYALPNPAPLSIYDKAALIFACGIMVEMDYSSLGSRAYGGSKLYDKMNMNYQYADRLHWSDEEWLDIIRTQLLLNRPIEYLGVYSPPNGHAYLLTGFQTTNMNTTMHLVNWGWDYCHPEYWSFQSINPASPYPYNHRMNYGIARNVSVNQTVLLENGSTDFSGIRIIALGHDGLSKTFTSDNGVFEIALPPGMYDFTITDISNYFNSIQINDVSIQMGTNQISPNPIVLTLRPNYVVVPTDVSTIQEAIDLVRNGGTVVIHNGNYTVSGLHWQDKHIKLQGQSQSGVIITNNPNAGLPAIRLDWNGINSQDIITKITFQNCDLTGTGYNRGAAIVLENSAAPIITNCTFTSNRVGNSGTLNLLTRQGVGGAVYIGGSISLQSDSPRFATCSFTDNYTLNANGGGAVAVYGKAQFTGCEFTGNKTIVSEGIVNPSSRDMGGAVIIYSWINRYDIDIAFENCIFNNNEGRSEADDVFVASSYKLGCLRFNGCTFTADTPHSNGAKPAIKFLNETDSYSVLMATHLILKDNKFLSSRKGAVYFCDYYGKNRLTFTGNVVANNMYDGYGVYCWYPDASSPEDPEYFNFSNNTFSNITGSGLILFQSPQTNIDNTVFENCSNFGISWSGYMPEHPDWSCRGLTLNNCLFSHTSPRYDFGGSTSNPLTENSVISVQNMHLDANYVPIWNSTTMSPCIDSGIGRHDPDNTPPDIGACRADTHSFWEYTFENQEDHERWHWVSYPVLNTRTNGMLQASEFFKELLDLGEDSYGNPVPTYLEEIAWVEGGDPEPILLQWLTYDWTPSQNTHHVTSQQGYKIKLLTNTPNTVTLRESGFKTPDTQQFTIYEDVENWIGYFKEGAQTPQDAFSSIWNDVEVIKAKNWGLQRDPNTGLLIGKSGVLNYGDMVVVVTNNDHNFQWANVNVIPPHTKPLPKSFTFDEKPDYIPVYITMPDSLVSAIKEIGLYVDGVCKGAVVVEDNLEQISAYVDSASELSQGNVEYVFSYEDSKGQNSGLTSLSLSSSSLQVKQSVTDNKYPYFEVSFTTDDVVNVVPPEFGLGQNYPNPFNPSTTLTYILPESTRARLDIYNIKGQLVKNLVDAQQLAGNHSAIWNGTDKNNRSVASGVYLYRLSSANKTVTKRMLLMK